MFVFDILQIPTGCIQICSRCIAPTCNPLGTDLFVRIHITYVHAQVHIFLDCLSLKTKAIWLFETSGNIYPMTQRNISKCFNLRYKHCLSYFKFSIINFKCRITAIFVTTDFFFQWRNSPSGPGPPHYRGFTIILRHTTRGRTPLHEWSARRIDLYWQHTTHIRDRHRCPQRDSNSQSQQASGRRPTP